MYFAATNKKTDEIGELFSDDDKTNDSTAINCKQSKKKDGDKLIPLHSGGICSLSCE